MNLKSLKAAALSCAFAALTLTTACSAAPAAAPPQSQPNTAFARVAQLNHGIAIWRWFDRPAVEADAHYANYVSDAELAQLRRWGFTAIRLPVGEFFLFGGAANYGTLAPGRIDMLRRAIARINAAGLAVVVDFHPDTKLKAQMETDAGLRDKTVAFWATFSKALADTDPNRVMLELLNEPRFQNDPAGWNDFMIKLHVAARSGAPNHTIIVDSAYYASLTTLPQVAVLDDTNMIYTVHFYTPMDFTAQGTAWTTKGVSGLTWPSDTAGCGAKLTAGAPGYTLTSLAMETAGVANTPAARARKYCGGGWNAARMDADVAAVAAWSKANNRPVWVGEFGVRALEAPGDARLRWLATAAHTFARYRMPSSLWSYDDCWGLSLKTVCAAPGTPNRMGAAGACATLQAIGLGGSQCVAEARALRVPGLADSAPGSNKPAGS